MEKPNCNQELRSGVTMSVIISVRIDEEVIKQIEEPIGSLDYLH